MLEINQLCHKQTQLDDSGFLTFINAIKRGVTSVNKCRTTYKTFCKSSIRGGAIIKKVFLHYSGQSFSKLSQIQLNYFYYSIIPIFGDNYA